MVDVQELAGSVEGLRQLGLMADLAERAHGNQVTTDWFYQNAGDATRDEARLTGDFQSLQERGWLWYERSVAGIDEVVLTQPGIDAATEFCTSRDSPRERMKMARDRVLHWLYDSDLDGNSSPVIDRFFESDHANYYGAPFTAAELDRASHWLHDEGLIAGTKTWGGAIPRPSITNKGIKVAESGSSVNAYERTGGSTVNNHVNIAGSHAVNVAVGSSDVQQVNKLTKEQIKQATDFIGSTRDLLPALGLSGPQQEAIGDIADELETETTSAAPRQSRMKELAGNVVDIVVTGTATGMVNALVAMGNGAIAGLG